MLAHLALRRAAWTLAAVGILTTGCLVLAAQLELRMNWTDLLPEDHTTVQLYRDVLDRFGEPSIVIALEGERDAIVAMAEELTPRLERLESLHNVVGKLPVDFFRDHAFALIKPERFDRTLDSFEDWTLVGTLRGLNDDFEREYVESESNLRRDEVEVARGLLGMTRSLELLSAAVSGEQGPEAMTEAADALSLGDPWLLSLDRRMLLIACTPVASTDEVDRLIATVEEVEAVMFDVAANHAEVHASSTGMGKISQDEMRTVGGYTIVLSLIALVLIYALLSRTFRGWVMPLLALAPLLVGMFWTMGVLYVLFGSLNLFTALMMLVLLGLGIDFSIHLISRFREEIGRRAPVDDAVATMLGGTGSAVIIGGLTTAMAFFTLMIGETNGVFEFGVAAGLGVILTLFAIFVTLPPLLVLRQRWLARRGAAQPARLRPDGGYRWIGAVAAAGWRHPGLFLAGTGLVVGASLWAVRHTGYEYDFLELEAKGLRSVELQREIPGRFGTSDHAAWLITQTVEQSRAFKEEFRTLPAVGDVNSISDFIPSRERLATYAPRLETFRRVTLSRELPAWGSGSDQALAEQVERLWDNLDLMSNLAFTAGLDRIVQVIDQMTGVNSETGETDTNALLPTLFRRLANGLDGGVMLPLAERWSTRLEANLARMTNPDTVSIADVPPNMVRTFTPRVGDGYLLHIVPRGYLWDKAGLERFASQTEAIDPGVIGSEKMILVMMDETLADGRAAALLALAVIAVLLLFHFRGPLGLLALVPLGVGTVTMLGLMYVFGMTYNYMNLIATPIILGIGIDDGVHALHRYREQRNDGVDRVEQSFQFVGKAILLTSLTTMIGFGSVAFYEMRGMASFGQVLFLGVGACFLATVLVLPAVLRVIGGHPKLQPAVEPEVRDTSYATG
jgi:predicted RND superfamily exporter protein